MSILWVVSYKRTLSIKVPRRFTLVNVNTIRERFIELQGQKHKAIVIKNIAKITNLRNVLVSSTGIFIVIEKLERHARHKRAANTYC